jgi:hypothetical protein
MKDLAEYFQITVPYSEKKDDAGNKWADVESSHVHGEMQGNPAEDQKFNQMPRTDIGVHETRAKFARGFGGDTDVSGVSTFENTPKLFKDGFKRREMQATDDEYSGEHIDLFYGTVKDEKGQESFVERNNYLDRL